MKKLKLYFAFYGSFAYVSLVFSGFLAFCVYNYGFETYTLLFWGKLLTLGIIFLYIRTYKVKEFYYYKNLGLSKKSLWIFSLSLDMLIYLAGSIIALNLHGQS